MIEIERQNDKFHNTIASVLQTHDQTARMRELGPMLKTLINMDGQEHRNYRAVTNDWFKPNNLRRTSETRIAELARKYVDRMVELGGECDFAMDVARFYPLQVIMSILGVPESDELKMLDLTQKLFGADDPDFAGGPDRQAAALAAVMDFISYFRDMTADRRAHPSGDLASTIANGTIDGQAARRPAHIQLLRNRGNGGTRHHVQYSGRRTRRTDSQSGSDKAAAAEAGINR